MITLLENQSSVWMQSLGWALLHSLWEIAAVVAALVLILGLMRHCSANLRYVTACVGLLTAALLPIGTYCFLCMRSAPEVSDGEVLAGRSLQTPRTTPRQSAERSDAGVSRSGPLPEGSAGTEEPIFKATDRRTSRAALPGNGVAATAQHEPRESEDFVSVLSEPSPADGASTSLPRRVTHRLSAWMPWCVMAWLLGVFMLSVWHLGGWLIVQRLKRFGTTSASKELTACVARLSRQIGLNRSVSVLQSRLVDVPIVIGWLRPVVLVPASIITGLPPAQLDAMLAHELAHIRRHDYLVNLLQTVAETLLFFHPGVWWISRRIRIEREYCCDDVAVAVGGSKVDYAETLTALEERRAAPGFAVALTSGQRNWIALARVRRVLGLSDHESCRWRNSSAGSLAALVLVSTLIGYVALAGESDQGAVEKSEGDRTGRAERFKETIDDFRLSIWYRGREAKKHYHLALHVSAAAPKGGSPFGGAGHDSSDEVHWTARIDNNQATEIIEYLKSGGFLNRARNVHGHRMEPCAFPGVVLLAEGPDNFKLIKEIRPPDAALKRVEGLRALLDDKAVEATNMLLAQLREAPAASIHNHFDLGLVVSATVWHAPKGNFRSKDTTSFVTHDPELIGELVNHLKRLPASGSVHKKFPNDIEQRRIELESDDDRLRQLTIFGDTLRSPQTEGGSFYGKAEHADVEKRFVELIRTRFKPRPIDTRHAAVYTKHRANGKAIAGGNEDRPAYHWSFDDKNVLDHMREVPGRVVGNVTFQDGILGKAAVIKDDSTRIDIQSPSLNLDGWEQVTVSMWCKMTGYSTYGRVLSRAEGNEGCGVALHVGGMLGSWVAGGFWVFLEDGSHLVIRPDTFRKNVKPHPKVGVWYHLVGTYDGKQIRFYVNGQPDGQQPAATPNLRIRDLPDARLVIGRAAQSPKYDHWRDTYFPGLVDELTIWKRALSPEEVKLLYEETRQKAKTAAGTSE